ncbi:putative 2-aminoethylphosphonate transport system permease protein PhnV [mine drainage metagenome]|uniref:Putative 2-aminoethylphosphonate transport system permease protein PhnV n=1 Tax=mine drainage metagenome TaxID=410659 RepID=A0A1J5Q0N3_9ZZZZ
MVHHGVALRLGAVALILILALLVAAPLLALAREAVLPFLSGGAITTTLQHWLGRDAGEALSGTLRLAAFTALFSVLLGGGMGLLAHLAPPRGLVVLEPLLLASFLIPPYLTAVAWSMLAGPVGLWQQALGFGGTDLGACLYSLPGMAAVMALHLTPLVYVMVAGALRGVDERLVDCAQVHGAGRVRATWTAYRPTVLPALAGAGLLVFLAASEEFGVPKVLGNYAGVRVLSVAVEEAMNVWPVDLPRASGIGLSLALLALMLWVAMRRLSGGEAVAQHQRVRQPRLWSALPLLLFAVMAAGLPLAAIVITASQKAITSGLQAGNWTGEHFAHVLRPGGAGLQALAASMALAVVVSVVSTALSLLMAWMLERLHPRVAAKLEVMGYLPQAIPGVVLATGLILFWNAPWNPLPVYGHGAVLAVAYLTLTFPYALRYAVSGLAQAQQGLTHAAAVHGAQPLQIALRIRLPLAWPLLLAGATVVFALSMRELAASILLQPPGMQVISTYVFEQFEQGNANDGMAMAVVGVLSTALLLGAARAMLLNQSGVVAGGLE